MSGRRRRSSRMTAVATDGSPINPGSAKTAGEPGAPSVVPLNPNSRLGRRASSHAQGREREPMFVGIDVSKDRLDVHVRPDGEVFTQARDGEGVAALIERLNAMAPELIVLEATGGFEVTVAAALAAAGLPLAIVNPRQIRDFARALGRLAKTDPIDVEVIARFAEAIRPTPRPLPDDQARALGELVARRRQIIEMMTAERNRRHQMTARKRLKAIERHL